MDIYQFAGYASIFTDKLWACLLVGLLCFLIVYIFQGMGLYVIAGHEGYGNRWMAWVPFLQIYYIGVCAQKNKVMNSFNAKGFAIAAAIFDIALFVGYTLYYVSYFLVQDYIIWEPYYIGEINTGSYVFGGYNMLPSNLTWAGWMYQYSYDYILNWLELIFIILKLFLYTSFYRTYSSRRYVLFSVVGALTPLNGIIIYIVRNNKGLNYNDYIRKVREENYRRYQQQQQQNMYNQNPYNQNPYNQNPYNQNPYGNNQNQYNQNPYNNGSQQQNTASDPFDEFGNSTNNAGNSADSGGSTNSNTNTGPDDSPFDDF